MGEAAGEAAGEAVDKRAILMARLRADGQLTDQTMGMIAQLEREGPPPLILTLTLALAPP